MANKPHQKRNDEIVRLHDLDPIKYSFRKLGAKFKNRRTGKPLSHSTIHEIYMREKAKGGDKKAISSGTVKGKYPGIKKL
jgi:hypothetical protein